jgi:hypothetical protein
MHSEVERYSGGSRGLLEGTVLERLHPVSTDGYMASSYTVRDKTHILN